MNLIYFFILFNTFLLTDISISFIRLTTYKIFNCCESFIGVTIFYHPILYCDSIGVTISSNLYCNSSKILTDNELLLARLLHRIFLVDYILIEVCIIMYLFSILATSPLYSIISKLNIDDSKEKRLFIFSIILVLSVSLLH